ncbi:right-handed parallel beta-helix repeat-containing protein [Amycolatopsis sp. NPDC051128]|uniref:right-handed parallel beta-helix repeat-containing protein n=1 Tax=Amycolatopsis sp. NPDC051128 TaxID=3155412 RepID=UPI003447410F
MIGRRCRKMVLGSFLAMVVTFTAGIVSASPVSAATVSEATARIQSLLDHPVDGTVDLPQGVFTVAPTLRLSRGLKIVGHYTVLRVAPGAGDYLAMLMGVQPSTDLSGLSITGVIFDQNEQQNPVTTYSLYHGFPRFAVVAYKGSGITIRDNQFLNTDNINTVVMGTVVDHSLITGNIFKTVDRERHDHSSIYTNSQYVTIAGNYFVGTDVTGAAIETHGAYAQITGNRVYGYYRGANIVSTYTVFSGNAVFCGVNLVALWSLAPEGLHDVEVRDNRNYYPLPAYWQALIGLKVPAQYLQSVIYVPGAQVPFVRISIAGNL